LRFRGVPGAAAALAGLLAAPSVVVVVLGAVYDRFAEDPAVRHAFAGLAAAAAGLLIGLAAKLVWPLRRQPVPAGLAVLCFLAIAVFRVPCCRRCWCWRRSASSCGAGAARERAAAGLACCSPSCRCSPSAAATPCCRRCSGGWWRCTGG
jgi:hypothetical protein